MKHKFNLLLISILSVVFVPNIVFGADIQTNQNNTSSRASVFYDTYYATGQIITASQNYTLRQIEAHLSKETNTLPWPNGCTRAKVYSATGSPLLPETLLEESNNCIPYEEIPTWPNTATSTWNFTGTNLTINQKYAIIFYWEGVQPDGADDAIDTMTTSYNYTNYSNRCYLNISTWNCDTAGSDIMMTLRSSGINIKKDCALTDVGCYIQNLVDSLLDDTTIASTTEAKWDTIQNNIIYAFPLGYITDFFVQLSTTTTQTVWAIDTTIPMNAGLPCGGCTLQLPLTGVLDDLLNATTSEFISKNASSTATWATIVGGYFDLILTVAAILYILNRILGTGLMPNWVSNDQMYEGINEKINKRRGLIGLNRKKRI